MKIFKGIAFLSALIAIVFYSCKKEGSTNQTTSLSVIRNTNTALGSGCGYILEDSSNGISFSPTNLPDTYKVADTVHVLVTYTILNTTFNCGPFAGAGYKQVTIKDIKKI